LIILSWLAELAELMAAQETETAEAEELAVCVAQ
jgi:hypothetical protein